MAQVINTNVMSLNAQRNLTTSGGALATTLQRLSSGLRINSAKDDAAGLAISERFTTQIRGLNQAVRNANDAISLSQTAEGALGEYSNVLQRVRELAVQAANSTNSSSDRAAINSEAQQMLDEMKRISTTTQFNGQNVLDGSFTSAQFQVGANANQTISVSIGNASTSALGAYQYNNTTNGVTGTALAAGDLTVNGVDVGATADGSADTITTKINAKSSQTNVVATATSSIAAANTVRRNQALQSGDLVINGTNIGAVAGSNTIGTQGSNIVAAINAKTAVTGVTASADSVTGAVSLSSSVGKTIAITTSNAAAGANRVENATGLELAGATASAATATNTFTGTLGVTSVAFGGLPTAGQTVIVNGTTYTFGDGTGGTVEALTSANATATNLFNAINTAEDLKGTGERVTASNGTAGTTTITSNYATSTMTHQTVTGTATTNVTINNAVTAGAGVAIGSTATIGGLTYEFGYAGSTPTGSNVLVALGNSATTNAQAYATAINAQYAAVATNIQVLTTPSSGDVAITSNNRGTTGTADVLVAGTSVAAGLAIGATGGGVNGTYNTSTTYGKISLSSSAAFQVGGTSPSNAGLGSAAIALSAISTVDISTVAGANSAISLVDGALAQISKIRADLGAVQNRFESTIANQSAISENLSAARSRIRDADYASETAMLTRAQILQQAGTAILSQANSVPQSVLSLLR